MSVTGIKTYENKVAAASPATSGGEIAVLLDAVAGEFDRMYTVASASEFARIFGSVSGNGTKFNDGYSKKNYYEFCNYLLNRGNVLRVVRAGVNTTGLVKASKTITKTNSEIKFEAVGYGDYYNNVYLEFVPMSVGSKYFALNIKYRPDANTDKTLENYPICSLEEGDYYLGNLASSIVKVAITGNASLDTIASTDSGKLTGGSVCPDASSSLYPEYEVGVAYAIDDVIIHEQAYYKFTAAVTAGNNTAWSAVESSVTGVTADVANPNVEKAFSPLKEFADKEYGITSLLLMCAVPSIDSTTETKTPIYYVKKLLKDRERDFVYIDDYLLFSVTMDDNVCINKPKVKVSSLSYFIPNGIVLADKYATLEKKSLSFRAPAGIPNGVLADVIDLEKIYTKEEIETMQEGCINPIVVKPGTGVVVWGQSTYTNNPTKITRLAVRLYVNYLKRAVYSLSQKYIFMDNTELTWNQWKNEVEPIVRDAYNIGGILNYRIVCDRTIMTDEDIQNGKMKGVIFIRPPFQINEIEITFSIDESGVSFE